MRAVGAAILASTFFVVAPAEGAMPFKCQSGPVGICRCEGTADCQDMRRSGMCDGALDCSTGPNGTLICFCGAAKSSKGTAKQPPAAGTMQRQ
jgi:hypothetical protein